MSFVQVCLSLKLITILTAQVALLIRLDFSPSVRCLVKQATATIRALVIVAVVIVSEK